MEYQFTDTVRIALATIARERREAAAALPAALEEAFIACYQDGLQACTTTATRAAMEKVRNLLAIALSD